MGVCGREMTWGQVGMCVGMCGEGMSVLHVGVDVWLCFWGVNSQIPAAPAAMTSLRLFCRLQGGRQSLGRGVVTAGRWLNLNLVASTPEGGRGRGTGRCPASGDPREKPTRSITESDSAKKLARN